MKQIILGTAGHIDHGKTSLIKAITGTDTDRLKEEKLRGITIELGFASLDLPNGQHIGIVDVPGHEKFVKNMVAGATGIDMVAMIIAADEGVMPQTREHMEICSLLEIQYGIVVLTKIDMVDEEWLELVTEDVRDFVQDTFLEQAPLIPVSSITRAGIPEFIQALEQICLKIPERPTSDMFRLPVDRVFSMKGFGTVITGSLVSGKIRVGETIMLYPTGITSKVRGIQVHGMDVDEAVVGMRTAINFQGLEKAIVSRGDVLAMPGVLTPSYMIDVSLQILSSTPKPIKNRSWVRFHSGTREIMGTLILLDREEALPGDNLEAQIRFSTPLVGVRDDRYVLRSYSPVRTIGGGRILNPIPHKHKRFNAETTEGLKTLVTATPEELVAFHVRASGNAGVSYADLRLMTNISEKQLQSILAALMSSKTVLQVDKEHRIFVHNAAFDALCTDTLEQLTIYHKAHPLKSGMPKEELKSKLPRKMSAKLFNLLMIHMTKTEQIVQEEEMLRLFKHTVSLKSDQADIKEKILDTYKKTKLTPPYFKELSKTLNIDPAAAIDVLKLLMKEGKIIKVKEDLYFDADALSALKTRLVDFLMKNDAITTPQFKDMTGASRKYVIPIIEYFDSKNITIRIGDVRKLRRGK